jgi:hypothetical protein
MFWRKKGKGGRRSIFGRVRQTSAVQAVTEDFVHDHMGTERQAENIAARRQLPVSHTIDIGALSTLTSEMRTRQQQGYYTPQNQVGNPNGNANQYLTANEYPIWETYLDDRGRLKKPKIVLRRFYYDAPAAIGYACHHFDGVA